MFQVGLIKFVSSVPIITRMSVRRLISVTPSTALVDTKVAIRVTGVDPNSHVTIRSESVQKTPKGRARFEGHAHYIADDRGVVSVPDQTSWGGTYTGTEPMGLFWSMQLSPGEMFGIRYLVKDITKPMVVNLSLYQGHLDTHALQTAEPEATTTAERWYLSQDVERIKVTTGRLRGAVFKPKGAGPFPGVIDMFGSAGGLIETRGAMFAARGLACYTLPFFNYDDLSPHLWELELEYFKEAVDWLSDLPFVKPGGIGMVGVSTGAQIVLATASHFPEKVTAAVSINGCHAHSLFPFKLNGEILPYIEFDSDDITTNASGTKELFNAYKCVYDIADDHPAVYQLEKATNCQFLFVAGQGETVWDSCYYAQQAMKRLARHGLHNYQLLSYPDAGHLIEVPYAPVGKDVYSTLVGGVVNHGGTVFANAKAMEDSWPKIVQFLHTHCGQGTSKL